MLDTETGDWSPDIESLLTLAAIYDVSVFWLRTGISVKEAEQLEDDVAFLKRWKEEAIAVMPDSVFDEQGNLHDVNMLGEEEQAREFVIDRGVPKIVKNDEITGVAYVKPSERLREKSWMRFSPLSEDTFRTIDLSDDVLAEIEQLEADAAAFAETAEELGRVHAQLVKCLEEKEQLEADAELGRLVRRMPEHLKLYANDDEYGPPDYVQVGTRDGKSWTVSGWYDSEPCRFFAADTPEEVLRKALGVEK